MAADYSPREIEKENTFVTIRAGNRAHNVLIAPKKKTSRRQALTVLARIESPGALFFKLSLQGDTIQEGALFKRGLYYFNHPPSKANQIFSSFLTVPSILKSN